MLRILKLMLRILKLMLRQISIKHISIYHNSNTNITQT
jgi:hypothetical protein